jgi:gluconokinase
MLSARENCHPLAIVVMGVSGSGKSTIGRALADALKVPYLEGDEFHSAANIAKMSAGIALQDEDRWPWLDALGTALGAEARDHGFAVGACSALKRSYRDRLRAKTGTPMLVVALRADPELIRQRMVTRPGHFMPASLLDSQLATLELPDADEHALSFNSNESIGQILLSIRAEIQHVSNSQMIAPGNG